MIERWDQLFICPPDSWDRAAAPRWEGWNDGNTLTLPADKVVLAKQVGPIKLAEILCTI